MVKVTKLVCIGYYLISLCQMNNLLGKFNESVTSICE